MMMGYGFFATIGLIDGFPVKEGQSESDVDHG